MDLYRTSIPLFAMLFLCPTVCLAVDGSDGVGCVGVALRGVEPQGPERPMAIATFVLTNNCAKDVTAVALRVRNTVGDERTLLTCADWVVRLAYHSHPEILGGHQPKEIGLDILRHGASEDFAVGLQADFPEPSSVVASIAVIIFLDRAAVGDSKGIEIIRQMRIARASDLQEEYDVLALLSDYSRARDTVHGVGVSVSANIKPLLDRFANTLEQSDSASWAQVVGREKQLRRDQIAVFRQQSELITAGTEQK